MAACAPGSITPTTGTETWARNLGMATDETVLHATMITFAFGLVHRFGFWVMLVLAQFALGAWTIWSNKAADVATSHVFVGALTFMTGVLLSVVLSAMLWSPRREDFQATWQKEVAKA